MPFIIKIILKRLVKWLFTAFKFSKQVKEHINILAKKMLTS